MSEPQNQAHQSPTQHSERQGLRESVGVFGSQRDARAHEIDQQARRSPYERMKQFMELQRRIWGTNNPDVRQAGSFNVEQRGL